MNIFYIILTRCEFPAGFLSRQFLHRSLEKVKTQIIDQLSIDHQQIINKLIDLNKSI